MKKEGIAETTIKKNSKKLKTLDKYSDLDNPETFKEYIANKKVSNTCKKVPVHIE